MISILHLSNLHFSHDSEGLLMRKSLLDFAKAKFHNQKMGEKMLIVSGDLHEYREVDYEQTLSFLKNLIKVMDIDPRQDVFLVPGNHDVGNESTLKSLLEKKDPEWRNHNKAAIMMLKNGDMEFIPERLRAFRPYSNFVRKLGIYDSSQEPDYPATTHIRNWRGKLNILHLNTALVADGTTKKDQLADVKKATDSKLWGNWNSESIPTIVLGHDSFYDLKIEQRKLLATLFAIRNVSAYLCGDTHLLEIDDERRIIPLEDGIRPNRRTIPNILCVKAKSEQADFYSTFGLCLHEWDERTDTVTLHYSLWDALRSSFITVDEAHSIYVMRRKASFLTSPLSNQSTEEMKAESQAIMDAELQGYLRNVLIRTREAHPSFKHMYRDKVDLKFQPNAKERSSLFIPYAKQLATGSVRPAWECIRDTWTEDTGKNIVLSGEAGSGKTVTLLSISTEESFSIPTIYLPLFELVKSKGEILTISDYCLRHYPSYGSRIIQLASRPWNKGPSLLVLLDGLDGVPNNMKWPLLHSINDWYSVSPGAQLILTTRPQKGIDFSKVLAGNTVLLELNPLNIDDVLQYLVEVGKKAPSDPEVLNLITNPLYLTLYLKSGEMQANESSGYPVKLRLPIGKGSLIWNYLQRELLRVDSEDWVIKCAITCEYILPLIAYEMLQKNTYLISFKDAQHTVSKALKNFNKNKDNLPEHLSEITEIYKSRHFQCLDVNAFKDQEWLDFTLHRTGVMQPIQIGEEKLYSFANHSFYECFAGICLVNRAEQIREDSLPEEWRKTHQPSVLDYVAELISQKACDKVWKANRRHSPLDRNAICLYLDVEKRRSDGHKLNFSGMDLEAFCFVPYLQPDELSMKLFRSRSLSVGTSCSLQTFWDNEQKRTINCINILDNETIVTSCDNKIYLWDYPLEKIKKTMNGHIENVTCLIDMPNNEIVSGSFDNTIRIWDSITGTMKQVPVANTSPVNCIAAIDSTKFITGSENGELNVWETTTGQCLKKMLDSYSSVTCIEKITDKRVVSGSEDGTLRVWDVSSGSCLNRLNAHAGKICCLSILPNGNIISGSSDMTLLMWNPDTGKTKSFRGHTLPVTCVTVISETSFVSGSLDGTLHVWDIASDHSRRFAELGCAVTMIATIDDIHICSGSDDGIVRIWNLTTGQCVNKLYHSEVDVTGMDLSDANLTPELRKMLRQNGATV